MRALIPLSDYSKCSAVKKVLFLLLAFALQQGLFGTALTQPRVPGRGPQERMERLQQFKKLRLMEILNLKEEQSIRFFSRYNRFEEELRDLERERNSIIDHLEMLVRAGEKGEALQKDFDALESLGEKSTDARTRFYRDIRSLLEAQETAKFIVFERNFNRELRDIIQDVQRERRREFRPR